MFRVLGAGRALQKQLQHGRDARTTAQNGNSRAASHLDSAGGNIETSVQATGRYSKASQEHVMIPANKRFIDIAHTIEHDLTTYPGLPAPRIGEFMDRARSRQHYAPGTEFHIGTIEMVANTGTYVDAPFHRYANGKDLAALPLAALADLDGVVIRTAHRKERAIDASCLHGLPLGGKAVLVHTGWSRHWRTELYGREHPFLTEDAAAHLIDAGVALVGIDSLNIDDTANARRPVHSMLLRAEIPIVEHLTNLDALPDRGFRFFAVPPMVAGLGSFPVRAFAIAPFEPLETGF
jgi:arylformamidase